MSGAPDRDVIPDGVPDSEEVTTGATQPEPQEGAKSATPEYDTFTPAVRPKPDAEGDDDAEPQDDQPDAKADLGKSVSRRIGELTREKYEARAALAERDRRIAELEARAPVKPADAAPADAKPKLDAFETYEDWVEAVADWRATTKFNELRERETQEQTQRQQREAEETNRRTYATNLEKALERYPDYHDVVDEMPVTRTMAAFLLSKENGPDMAYALAKMPGEAKRIAALDPVTQGYELAKLETKLTAPAAAARKVSAADPPINPVRPTGNANNVSNKDPAKAKSMAEYAALRNKQLSAERARGYKS